MFRIDADGRVTSYNGPPEPGAFLLPGQAEGGRERFLSLDFVWSLIEAQSVTAGGK